ncbi:MAG TPA: hypothetical protein VFD72_07330 [Sphingobacteriaceae bacterium]|nr:hypothetical protein [Sphingobacteriaceae bacterium]
MDKYFTRLTYILGLILITFSACNKDDKIEIPKQFPVVLHAERWELRGETRLFSDNSEIKDANVIQAYEARQSVDELFEIPFAQSEEKSALHFESETVARFHIGSASGQVYDIDRKGTRFLFQARNPYWINPSAPPTSNSLGFFHGMLKFKEPLGNANSTGDRPAHAVWVGHGNFKVLKVSAFAYVLSSQSAAQGEGEPVRNQGVIYNEFDPVAVKYLTAADTLLVKEYAVIYTLAN